MTEEEIITGILVTGGCSDDGKQLHELLQQTKHNQVQVTDKAKQGQNSNCYFEKRERRILRE